ncbi:SDR family NAD(P)-dependent oxidoreductase [Bacillus salitolerans]|uniref:SDR family NAD(P)-dependent oxidoreductase n=1 Tax=Bacillus salitolerans TaxID=1437434 RepID=A0ABW4LT58_9BACI
MYTYGFLEKILFPSTYLDKEKLKSELKGKTILITGASSGIGEQVAYMLAEVDAHLLLVARREDRLITMKSDIEKNTARVSVFKVDLRNEAEVETLLAWIHQLPHGLDVVISNAGKSIKRPIYQSLDRYHDMTRTMAVNYLAPVQIVLSVIPLLTKNRGHIINISTINTKLVPFPYWAAYQASKSAFDTWFRSVAPELNANGLATTSIYLPLVQTPMISPTVAYQNMPAMHAKHVAAIICKSLYTKRKSYQPWWLPFGQVASLLFSKLSERFLPRLIRKKGDKT